VSPEEIGSLLRITREELGRTIADAASATKISSIFLFDMEKGEFRKLGERPYVIGFVKTYAKYLGLCEKSFSEMVRKNHSEMEEFNLQMYKTGR
jgi:cytoskeletal protein RodZ